MAAPQEKTLKNLGGKWTLNKDLSDDFTQVLELQGVNIMIRKAVGMASVHLKISQPTENHVQMEQQATAAAIPGTTEDYTLDWEWRTNQDAFFGEVEGRSRWVDVSEATDGEGVDGQWEEKDQGGMLIQAVGKKPDGAWEAVHFWGFENVDGQRRHTRRVKITSKEGKELKVRMVYDFDG